MSFRRYLTMQMVLDDRMLSMLEHNLLRAGKNKNNSHMVFDIKQKLIATTLALMALVSCGTDSSGSGFGQKGTAKDENRSQQILMERPEESSKADPNTDTGTSTLSSTHDVSDHHAHDNPSTIADFVKRPEPLVAILNYGKADIFNEIRDKDGNFPTDPDEPLYAANRFQPPRGLLTSIKAPDGHHVTLSEFKKAKGYFRVNCNGVTSTVEISLEGMIPNGTYTTWLGYLNKTKKPGDPISSSDFVSPINPPLGNADGSDNVLIADAEGVIDVTIEHPTCVLAGAVALGMPISYHINGNTYGAGLIPDVEEVTQLLVYFQ